MEWRHFSSLAQQTDVLSELRDIRGPLPVEAEPSLLWLWLFLVVVVLGVLVGWCFFRLSQRPSKPLPIQKSLQLQADTLLKKQQAEITSDDVEDFLRIFRLYLADVYGYPVSFDSRTLCLNIRRGPNAHLVPIADGIEALEESRFAGAEANSQQFAELLMATREALSKEKRRKK